MLNVIFDMFSKILIFFRDYHKIESSDDSKSKIDLLRGTKIKIFLLSYERKFYI